MEKIYSDMIKAMTDKGWNIEIVFKKNKVSACICHDSWITNDHSQAIALPEFHENDFNGALKKVYNYFYS